ncbi:hypothetical protein H4R19_003761 [Coemansia spiralis]|nr:hypothetical protein H4R19_003761 [Coemansia spiralis]
MALAAGAAVTAPALSALGSIAYYAKHPSEDDKEQKRRPSFLGADSKREFILDDDPSDFSTFSSPPAITRRRSQSHSPEVVVPDHRLLEDPQLQVWRDRYKWGRAYGMNFAHNDK